MKYSFEGKVGQLEISCEVHTDEEITLKLLSEEKLTPAETEEYMMVFVRSLRRLNHLPKQATSPV